MITFNDIPFVLDSLKEKLIKDVANFTITGCVYRCTPLTYWFDPETITEVFDELYLDFCKYLEWAKGIDLKEKYILLRYIDSSSFILFRGPECKSLV